MTSSSILIEKKREVVGVPTTPEDQFSGLLQTVILKQGEIYLLNRVLRTFSSYVLNENDALKFNWKLFLKKLQFI